MKYIGLSLGGCLRSIMADEVSEDDVMFIVTQTRAPTFSKYMDVVEHYHGKGNPYARNSVQYELNSFPLEDVTDLATRLWNDGKIHQPRIFVEDYGRPYSHPISYGNGLWIEVAPSIRNTTPAVVEAYKHYKMLDALTKQ